MIKEARDNDNMIELLKQASENDIEAFEFIRPMIETSDDKKLLSIAKERNWQDLEFLGVLIFGKRLRVEEITVSFPLVK
jgi:hypothetical protein